MYRKRRSELTAIASTYKLGTPIPRVQYSQLETDTWGTVFGTMKEMHMKYACAEYLNILPVLEQYCGMKKDNIPQLQDISKFLKVIFNI